MGKFGSAILTSGSAMAMAMMIASGAAAENTLEDWSWKVDHFERFEIFESACDHRDDEGTRIERCYITHVDVYASRPQFGAAFFFLTPAVGGGDVFEFRFERGTRFAPYGFRVEQSGATVWSFDHGQCTRCILAGADARLLGEVLAQGGEIVFEFTDRFNRNWTRRWSAAGFGDALADHVSSARSRGLR